MNIIPRIYKEIETGKRVSAVEFDADAHSGECVVTVPLSISELTNLGVDSVSGLWTHSEFKKRFKSV